jgi:glycosyltransferase involved in cell wall biosynthesis
MRIAIVHELLTRRGGAERVLKIIADLFPEAPIYTLLYDERALGDWFPKHRVRPSNLDAKAWLGKNHHLYLKHFPAAVEAWDFSEFDLVLGTSSAFVHGIITNSAPKHLCYVHSPARYLWDRTHDVLDRAGRGPLGWLKRAYLSRVFHRLRAWDAEVADRPDMLLAASAEVQRRIELYWRRPSEVLHPPIDDTWLEHPLRAHRGGDYYLVASQLSSYKRIELAIEACNLRGARLIIAGEGPAKRQLQTIAGPTIEFAGYVTDAELGDLYRGAKAVLFPGHEDFGLVPLEAMACGTPVIAYRAGGALETIVEGETGEFFDEPMAESLADAMQRLESRTYDPVRCRANAERFSRERFENGLRNAVNSLMNR